MVSTRLVTSKRIITSATIPTEEKSPNTTYGSYACYVGPVGDVYYDYYSVRSSYGCFWSPGISNDSDVIEVYPTGLVYIGAFNHKNSYGLRTLIMAEYYSMST